MSVSYTHLDVYKRQIVESGTKTAKMVKSHHNVGGLPEDLQFELVGDNYEYSLGLNGLGLCATQYASEWMTADIWRDGFHYHLEFRKGENVGGLSKEPAGRRKTGSKIRWKPDRAVFTDINVPTAYYLDTIKRQAVVNAGVTFVFTDETAEGGKAETVFYYEKGIENYVEEIAGLDSLTPVRFCQSQAEGKDREDRPAYKVKMSAAFCFSNKNQLLEYYHNSSYLEHGGSPDKAVKTAFVAQIDGLLRQKGLYKKNDTKIKFEDIQDCLIFVSSSFSTQTSYENQTKKAITNRFIQQAMTEFLKHNLEVDVYKRQEIGLVGITLVGGEPAQHALHRVGVLQMEGLLVVLF